MHPIFASRIARAFAVSALLPAFAWLDAGTAEAACAKPPDPAQMKALGLWQSSIGGIDSAFLIPGKKVGGNERTTAIHGAAVVNGDIVSIAFLGGTTAPPVLLVLADDCTGVATCGGSAVCRKETLAYGSAGSPAVPWVSFTAKNFDVGGHVRAGKVRLAVTPKSEVPCWLLDQAQTCNHTPLPHACIDQLQSSMPGAPKMVTALPPPNDFSAICVAAPGTKPCNGNGKELWLALDSRGDLLIPMDWGKITTTESSSNVDCVEGPTAPPCRRRDVSATTTVPATSSGVPIQLPSDDYLQSLNADGEAFVPGPVFAVDTANTGALGLYGTVDKAFSVLRILGCPPTNADCATRLFDLSNRREPGGPVVLRRKGNGKGECAVSGAECPPPCSPPESGPCIGFDGKAEGFTTNSPPASPPAPSPPPPPAPAPPPPPPPPPGATPAPGAQWPYWLLALAAVGLVWLWVHKSAGSGKP